MAVSFITTNTIGAGVQFTFAATGNALVVLEGVTLGSTTSVAFTTSFSDVEVTVLGTMVSTTQVSMTTGSSFTLAETGTFLNYVPTLSLAGLFMNGAGGVTQIDGTFSVPEAIGLLASGGGQRITVTGSLQAASGIYVLLGGTEADSIVNSGRIIANAQGDVGNGTQFNNAVYIENNSLILTNLDGGVILATSSEGNAIRLGTVTGTILTNHGTLQSLNAAAVNTTSMGAAGTVSLINTGLIQGRSGAYYGGAGTDTLVNSGHMIGDVFLDEGNDSFDGRGGRVDGQWFGDTGNDRYDGRGATLISGPVGGGDGNDTLLGGDGSETMNGDGAADTLRGGGGDDFLTGGQGDDLMSGEDGNDALFGGLDTDDLLGGAGDDTLAGDDGALFARGGSGDDELTVDASLTAFFLGGYGGAGNDTFQGGQARDNIFGGAGDDEVYSDDGGDLVHGGAGDDILDTFDGDDSVFGGVGDDVLTDAAGNDVHYGGRGFDTMSGGEGNEFMDGGADDDSLDGGNGLDTLQGGSGDDLIAAGGFNDLAEGGSGDDVILAGGGNDRANGGTGNDALQGEAGKDTLTGGAGDDTLTGGAAGDLLAGGTGADVFVLAAIADSGTVIGSRDQIQDFLSGTDVLDLGLIDANTGLAGDQTFTFIGENAFSNTAGELQYVAMFGVLLGDVNGDGVQDFVVEFANFTTMTAGDFVL